MKSLTQVYEDTRGGQAAGLGVRGQAPAVPDSYVSPGLDRVPITGCPLPQRDWPLGGICPTHRIPGTGTRLP